MKKTQTALPGTQLIGITVRTNNAAEINPAVAQITPTVQRYFQQGLPDKIPNRKNPGITFCAFTDYESDFTGGYTYFVGEEVTSFATLPDGFARLAIPPQTYAKLTIGPGPMPGILIQAWQTIWQMTPEEFGGKRRYHTDFEIYDHRAADPHNTTLDIYLGVH